jgi:hypothetical protein
VYDLPHTPYEADLFFGEGEFRFSLEEEITTSTLLSEYDVENMQTYSLLLPMSASKAKMHPFSVHMD